MNSINIGNKIRELRKKRGITQEVLAFALSVTPQSVSKWESGLTYPDMTMIPVLAEYFEVSLDTLFDYDVKELRSAIQKIIDGACKYFFSNTEKYIDIMREALREHPGNEALLTALLDAYEYDLRENKNAEHIDDMIEISQRIITESNDFVRICNIKETQAAAYLEKGEYEKAKALIDTLPDHVNLKNDVAAFRLSGKDKVNAAVWARCNHLQKLYQACMEEGDAWFKMDSSVKFETVAPAEYPENALRAYRQGLAVLTAFINSLYTGEDSYMWAGMQTFHWSFHQRIAACLKRLGRIEECSAEVDEAYRIISTAWDDFERDRDGYMKYFNQYLYEFDLSEYVR